MKPLLAVVLSLFFLNDAFALGRSRQDKENQEKSKKPDFSINFNRFVTFSDEFQIKSIDSVRLQLNVAGDGARKKCFKKFEPNPPHKPNVEPYMITQNLVPEISGTVLNVKHVFKTFENLEEMLDDKLPFGCEIVSSGLLMIKGTLSNGTKFQASPLIGFSKNKPVIIVGAKTTKIPTGKKLGEEIRVSLISSPYLGKTWDRVWESLDPKDLDPVKNYE